MRIIPITYQKACDFVNQYHRHHSASQGCKFCIGLQKGEQLIGVAICGRPVARKLDDGFTLEISRVCTLGDKNSCSMLYGACCRIAKDMGYKEVITYTLESESGISLKASNFTNCGVAGGKKWNGIKETKEIIQTTLFGEEIIKKAPPEEIKIISEAMVGMSKGAIASSLDFVKKGFEAFKKLEIPIFDSNGDCIGIRAPYRNNVEIRNLVDFMIIYLDESTKAIDNQMKKDGSK